MTPVKTIRGGIYTAPNKCEYLVTDEGEVYRKVGSSTSNTGKYRQTQLGRGHSVYIHQLVCEMFHGKKPAPHYEVRHLDGNPQNNHPENLRWGTRAENVRDMVDHGRAGKHTRKLTEEQAAEVKAADLSAYGSATKMAKKMGVNPNTILDIKHGRTWV